MPVPMMAPHQGEGETGGQPTARQGAGDPERDDDRTEEEDLAIAALEGDEPAGHRLGDAGTRHERHDRHGGGEDPDGGQGA
jgi:hypothetical protein